MADPDMVMVFDSNGNKFQIPRHMLSQFNNMGGRMRSRMPMGDEVPSETGDGTGHEIPRRVTDEEFSNKLWGTPSPLGNVPSSDGMGEQKVIGGKDPRVKAEEAYQKLSRGRLGGPR